MKGIGKQGSVDYLQQPFLFKLRKALRYARLYGLSRTLAKARAYPHLARKFERLPDSPPPAPGSHVGLIGCGRFGYAEIAYTLRRDFGRVLRLVMDSDPHRAASLGADYRAAWTDDAGKMFQDPEIDLVFVASNHASHAEYAVRALEAGKSVHIEKPHVVSDDQLRRLCAAMAASKGKVRLGFNRPDSPLGALVRKAVDAESGPSVINWFVAGHEIDPDHWYFKEEEGGRVLGNLCHWIDFVYRLVPADRRFPIEIRPARWEKSDCDIAVSYVFGEGTVAAITFSAKGHAFEGVRERLSLHRGGTILTLDDFAALQVETGAVKRKIRRFFRDHGHQESIWRSYRLVRPSGAPEAGCEVQYVWDAGRLMLRTKQALDENRPVRVEAEPYR